MLTVASLAQAGEKPAAVQVCVDLPQGMQLFSTKADSQYRLLGEGQFILDLDVKVNGNVIQRLTRTSAECVRAWVPAPDVVKQVSVSFDRTTLNLSPEARSVDLKLKPDLWYDAGRVTVRQLPFSSVKLRMPGQLSLERQAAEGMQPITDFKQVPSGVYKVGFELPPNMRTCDVTMRSTALGSIREDNKKAMVDDLVEIYRTEYVPDVLADMKMKCNPGEAVQVEVLLIDGVYFKPREPKITKVKIPSKAPHYSILINGVRSAFESGQMVTVHTGEEIVLEESAQGLTATN